MCVCVCGVCVCVGGGGGILKGSHVMSIVGVLRMHPNFKVVYSGSPHNSHIRKRLSIH